MTNKLAANPALTALDIIKKLYPHLYDTRLPKQTEFLSGRIAFNLHGFSKANLLTMRLTCYNDRGKKSSDAIQDILFSRGLGNYEQTLSHFRNHGENGITGNSFGRGFSEENMAVLWNLVCHRFSLLELTSRTTFIEMLKNTEFPVPITIFERASVILYET